MALSPISNHDARMGAEAYFLTNNYVSLGVREGVGASATTMESLEQEAPMPASQSQGFCAQFGSKLKEFADVVWNALSGIFNAIKSFFGKGDSTRVGTPPDTPLEKFRLGVLFQFENRDQLIAAFNQLPALDRNAVKEAMWNLAGEDINDEDDIQPYERHPAEDWAGRVIRGEVQLPDETGVRQDIQRYSDRIGEDNGLLAHALLDVINEAAGVSRLPENSFSLPDLQRLLSEGNLNRTLILEAMKRLGNPVIAVSHAMKDIANEDLRRENSPLQLDLDSDDKVTEWSFRIIINLVRNREETEDRRDIVTFVDILAPNSVFRRAVDRVVLAGRTEYNPETM
ncbi:MAG: hypothetical protein JSR39_01635 [Verrucomicrobia bacterium]|nr:hypothetical protein [Verrucomicrobiota bacterium]